MTVFRATPRGDGRAGARGRRSLVTATLFSLLVPAVLRAQAPPDSERGGRIERAVEKLVAFDLIDDRIHALRPWSEAEVWRMLDQARDNLGRLEAGERAAAERVLTAVRSRPVGAVHADARLGLTALRSPWRAVPSGPPGGGIDAEINPLAPSRGGRTYEDGATFFGEVGATGGVGRVGATLRYRAAAGRRVSPQWLEAFGRIRLGGLHLDVGRHATVWGQAPSGGSLLSDRGRGVDGFRLTTDAPFEWPGFLRFIGPSRVQLVVTRLESDRDVPRTMLVGYSLAARPHRTLELAVAALVQSGGEGAPSATFWRRVADHLLVVDYFVDPGTLFTTSNKATSASIRWRVPGLRGTQLYAEHSLEDTASNLRRWLWQDAAWLIGAWVPRFTADGAYDLRIQAHHGGVRLHRHHQFTSGRTVDRRLIGLGGPGTNTLSVHIGRDLVRARLALELTVESRSRDGWVPRQRPSGGIDSWEKIEDWPEEVATRAIGVVSLYGDGSRALELKLGIERVGRRDFVAGVTAIHGLAELAGRMPIGPSR